jgi:hypothetical protein
MNDHNQHNQQISGGDDERLQKLNSEEFPDKNDDDDSDEDGKKKNKRRSKADNDGRNHRCQFCGKSYLSYPALYTHIKTKHNTTGQTTGRGRGRPKKDTGETINTIRLLYNPSTMDYYKHPERMGEVENVIECIMTVFAELYQDDKMRTKLAEKKMRIYDEWTKHPFYLTIVDHFQKGNAMDGENSKCDEVFSEYLLKVSKLAKKEQFNKILKFVTLFRECLNIINSNKCKEEGKEYSESYNAEDAPDISNEYVTEFLETEAATFDLQKEEAIDLTQNFCQWLYDNNYTCSKLSLVAEY